MGTSNLNHIGRIVQCDEATYHEWKEEITALLSGLSLGHYLTLELDYSPTDAITFFTALLPSPVNKPLLLLAKPAPRCGI